MSRHRSISTDISTDRQVAELAEHGPLPLLLYTWAIPHADDWGRLSGDPRQFRLLVCPGLDVTARDVEQALTLIAETGLWLRYEVGGKWYIAFPPASWFKHQNYIPKDKRGKDKSAFPAPGLRNPTYQLTEGSDDPEERDSPQIPADHRKLPQIVDDRRKSPQNPASPSPSPTPTVDTDGEDTSGERVVAPVASASASPLPTHGALALVSPSPLSKASAIITPLKPVQPPTLIPKPTPKVPPKTARPPDLLWDACVVACDGDGPSNDAERGKWNKGLKSLRQSGATPDEIAIRAERYRRRYGDGIPLNPMALASNWTPLSRETQEVHDYGHTGNHTGNRNVSDQRGAGASGRSSRWNANAPKPLPDADYWERERQRLAAEGRLAKPRSRSVGELPDVQ